MKILLAAVNSKYIHTNLAIRYIKACCSEMDIVLKEYNINDLVYDIISDIYAESPDIIGFSCYIWNIDMVLRICSSLKKVLPSCSILLGGPEAAFDSRELMENNDYIDYIIRGEGEISSLKLFQSLENGSENFDEIKGLVYRYSGDIMENGENELIDKLDSIPFPYGHDMDSLKNKILYYESSRGCPYNCSYCLSSTIRGVRFFSLDRVKSDLMWFIDNNVKLVKFVDRTFNCGSYYKDIFKFLVENKKNTRFHFEISGEILDSEAIEYLNTVPEGLFQFEIGVQSTNNAALDAVGRRSNIARLFKNVERLMKNGNIHIHLDLIAGLPAEGMKSFSTSFNDVFSLRPDMLQLGFLKLLKGSRIRKDADKLGIVYTDYSPYEVLYTKELSFQDMCELKGIESVVDRYYNSSRFAAALMYLIGAFRDPFALFTALSHYLKDSGYEGRGISNIGQYKLLHDFAANSGMCNMDIVEECLMFDYLRQGRNPVLPDFLNHKNSVDRQYIWDFCSQRDNIDKYLPHYKGMDTRHIINNIYAARFSFDICMYIKSGIIDSTVNTTYFDYGTKNKMDEVYFFCTNM